MSSELPNNAGVILGEAFIDYPVINYAFPDVVGNERQSVLTAMWTKVAGVANEAGNVFISEDQTGAILWIPKSSFRAIFNWKIMSIPFIIGVGAAWRLIRHEDETESFIEKNAADTMGYISGVGVTPAGRGQGHCRALMEKCFTEMKKRGITECWLKTDKEVNVVIYSKIGFHVELEHIAQSSGLKSWAMKMELK